MSWEPGEYECCNGSKTCANNKLKKQVDEFIELVKKDEGKAREELYCWIEAIEMDRDWAKAKLSATRKGGIE